MSRKMPDIVFRALDRNVHQFLPKFADDLDLEKRVKLFLHAKRTGFRRINVWADSGVVRLSGPVRSFYIRQLAIAITQRVAGVRRVIDDLEVDLAERAERPLGGRG